MKTTLYIALLLLCLRAVAQDAHLSQYSAPSVLFNPANTGTMDDGYRVHLHYRTQWRSLTNYPFVTTHVAYDQVFARNERFGFGGYLLNNRAGAGKYNAFHFVASAAYEVTQDPGGVHRLFCGLQLGLIHKSFNAAGLTFHNQYNIATGAFDPSANSYETFGKTGIVLPEVNFGLKYKLTKPGSRFRPYMDIAGYHLTSPQEAFTGQEENRLPARIVVHPGASYLFDPLLKVNGRLLLMKQTNNTEFIWGGDVNYYLEQSGAWVFLGSDYRIDDAWAVSVGMEYKDYLVRAGYDFTTSSLEPVNGRRGGFEFSITYVKPEGKFIPSVF